MMDWADEIAASLVQENSTEGYDGCLYFDKSISEDDCARALRDAYERGKKERLMLSPEAGAQVSAIMEGIAFLRSKTP